MEHTDVDLTENMNSLGTETAFEVLARAEQLMAEGRDIINLGIGQPDFRTPDHVVEAAVKALRDGHHGYTPAQGILPLREAVAEDLHAHHGATVSPANIAIMPPHVWRTRFRNYVSRPRVSHLPVDD
jgi:aspartate aminotransferase